MDLFGIKVVTVRDGRESARDVCTCNPDTLWRKLDEIISANPSRVESREYSVRRIDTPHDHDIGNEYALEYRNKTGKIAYTRRWYVY